MTRVYKFIPPEDRFWSHVNKSGRRMPHMRTKCWEWTGSCNKISGYGQFASGRGLMSTHRYAWEIHEGSIATGKHILHKCDNRRCVRFDHLFEGTAKDNMMDKAEKGNARKKLTNESALRIRRRYDDKEPVRRIAKDEGVSASLVCAIGKRRIWRHAK